MPSYIKEFLKAKKEDYDIDGFITNLKAEGKKKAVKKALTFEELETEIIYFIRCVDNKYYCIPNKIISKKERSTWRFKVKRYYKELTDIMPDSKNGELATIFLTEIFKRLSTGSHRLLFSNWETFKAIGISQDEYYDMLIKRFFFNGYTEENLQKCINLLEVPKDPYELSYSMFWTFMSNLETLDIKEKTLELLKNKVENLKEKLTVTKNSHMQFEIKEDINNFVKCILEIYILINQSSKGIGYFHKNYIERDNEVKEYILLEKIEELNLKDVWIKEYESKINKIDFRDYLIEKYHKFKNS